MSIREADDTHALFQKGLDLFNDEQFFEAHESWEILWHKLKGPDKQFIQGLIFASAHFIHLGKNSLDSAKRSATTAKQKCSSLPRDEAYIGIDIMPLISALEFNLNMIKLIDIDREKTMIEIIKERLFKDVAIPPTIHEDINNYREKFELKNLDPFLIPKLF